MIQKIEDRKWVDETGKEVPVEYLTPGQKLKERSAATLQREAHLLNKRLVEYRQKIDKICKEVYRKAMEEYKVNGGGKGNYTWYNFDRSVRVEVSVNDRIDFDDLAIRAAKEKLDQFLSENLDSKAEFVKDLVIDAFSTTRGKIDAKKVFSLMKYRGKIRHELFQEALNILEGGISRPDSKTYFRISEKQSDGSYKTIELNFSAL